MINFGRHVRAQDVSNGNQKIFLIQNYGNCVLLPGVYYAW